MATVRSNRRAASQPRHASSPQPPDLRVIIGQSGRYIRPPFVIALAPMLTIAAILLGGGVTFQHQQLIQDLEARVNAASVVHDEEVLAQENLESPLRINDQVVHAARLVTPTVQTQLARVSLDVPVRTIEVGPAPVHHAGTSTTPTTTSPSSSPSVPAGRPTSTTVTTGASVVQPTTTGR